MVLPRARVFRQHDPKLEEIIQEGCRILAAQDKPKYTEVARGLSERHSIPVPAQTLRNRFLGKSKSPRDAHQSEQLLSPEQEQVLVDWIQYLSSTGHPLSKRTIRKKAHDICGKKPSRNWIPLFLRRHPEIKLGKPSGLDPKRAQAFNRPVVGHHFDLLKKVIEDNGIPWENIYNMDEKGCQRGGGRKASSRKYFMPRGKCTKYKMRSGNLELVTIIECVSADGSNLAPAFVFQGKEFDPEWFEEQPDICISTSPNGWTDNAIGVEWFKQSFVPQATARNTSGKPILLVYDGHDSHETIEINKLARENNIILFNLPPHTTHKLQPLDVGVFGPFSRAWIDRCDEIVEDTGREMPREDFVKEYMAIRRVSFKKETILQAWRKSGIRPLNPDIFTDDDYAPSIPTSTSAYVPSTYPTTRSQRNIFELEDESNSGNDRDSDGSDEDWSESDSSESGSDTSGSEMDRNGVDDDTEDEDDNISIQADGMELPIRDSPPARRDGPSIPITQMRIPPPIQPESFYATLGNRMPFSRSMRSLVTAAGAKGTLTLPEKLAAAQADTAALESRVAFLEAHCAMAVSEIQDLKQKMNARDGKGKKKKKLNVNARVLTSAEGIWLCEERDAERKAKEQKEKENKARKAEKEAEHRRKRAARDPNKPFTGGLSSKSKPNLQDIADALDLLEDGTKADILGRLNNHFDSHPELRTDSRFVGLFNRTRGQKRAAPTNDENLPIAGIDCPHPSSRRRLDNQLVAQHPSQSGTFVNFAPSAQHAGPSRSSHNPSDSASTSHSNQSDIYRSYPFTTTTTNPVTGHRPYSTYFIPSSNAPQLNWGSPNSPYIHRYYSYQ